MARRTVSEHHAKLIANTAAYEAGMARAVAATKAAEGRIAASGRGMGGTFQNVGYQVQDFAVQVAGGTSALRAFGQQAPQFLGAFGPGGAIAGAVVSVGALIAQIVMATKETKAASAEADKLADAFSRLAKERRDAFFGKLSPEDQVEDLKNQEKALKAQADAAERVRAAMIGSMGLANQMGAFDVVSAGAKIEGVEINPEGGAMRRQAFAERLAKLSDEAQQKIVDADTKREALGRKRLELEDEIAKKIGEANRDQIAENVKLLSERMRAEFKFSEEVQKLDKWRADEARERMEQAVSDAIQDIYGGMGAKRPGEGQLLPEIPVNSYQRRGLSLDPDGGAGMANQREERQIDLLESIDSTLKSARRSGVLTWQTN